MTQGRGWSGKVISFGARENQMKFSAISQIDAYWEGLRDGRLMPMRSEIDPRGMEGALENAILMEVVAPGIPRIRVSGMHMTDLLGMEVRGMPLTAFFEPSDRKRLQDVLKDVVETPNVAEVSLSSPGGVGRPPLNARLYLAPLGSDLDKRPRILGALQAQGSIGRTPRRFAIESVHKRRIVASAGMTRLPETKPMRQMAETQTPFDPAPQGSAAERPYLRLVRD